MLNSVKVEVFPAAEGDCFLISSKNSTILIDAGVYSTYHDFLKPRLKALSQSQGKLDLLVVTHIDRDHIEGVIELLKENGNSLNPSIIPIDQVWHNSYRHLQFTKQGHIGITETEILKSLITAGKLSRHSNDESKDISAKQGSTLAALLLSGGYSWNDSFHGEAINSDLQSNIPFTNFTIRLLSPNSEKLSALSNTWKRELKKLKYNFSFTSDALFDDALEFSLLMKGEETTEHNIKSISKRTITFEDLVSVDDITDRSVTNGSSIAFILNIEGRNLLFLGDSHPDLIADQLQKITDEQGVPLHFDLVKISHHGSSKNTNTRLLDLIICTNYIISTDGTKHGHPDLSTLAKVINQSSSEKVYIYCNYHTENADYFTKSSIKPDCNYSFIFPNTYNNLIIEL